MSEKELRIYKKIEVCVVCDGYGSLRVAVDEEEICRQCDGRGYTEVLDEPITKDALNKAGWFYNNGADGRFERWVSGEEDHESNRIVVYIEDEKVKVVMKSTYTIGLSTKRERSVILLRNCTTMEQLDALAVMLLGEKVGAKGEKEAALRKHIADLGILLESARKSEKEWCKAWEKSQRELGKQRERMTELQEEVALLKLYMPEDKLEEMSRLSPERL